MQSTISNQTNSSQTQSKCPFTRLTGKLKQVFSSAKLLPNANREALAPVIEWIVNHVAKPHAELGRPGPVCPFLPRALKENSIFYEGLDMSTVKTAQELDAIIMRHSETFRLLEPKRGKARLNKAMVITFQNLSTEQMKETIEGTQHRLKRHFVTRGLMLGEFHGQHTGKGVHSETFHPLRSPVPLLVIRHMIPSDLQFLLRESDDIANRIEFVHSYIERFQSELSTEKLAEAERSLRQLQLTQKPVSVCHA